MNIRTYLAVTAAAMALSAAGAGTASAGTIFVNMGPTAENFTLYGQGAYAPGLGSFTIGQGSSTYDVGTNTSTFTMTGAITGGSAGWNSGTFAFVTKYSGVDTPQAGPNAPEAVSNPANSNEFFYSALPGNDSMTLELFGTPSGNHTIQLVTAGNFDGPGFGFGYTAGGGCTGVAVCGQNNVGLTPGATIFGPVDISVSFAAVPEPATWAMMLVGLGGLGAMMRRRKALAAA